LNQEYVLRMEAIGKEYYGNRVLENINLAIKPGEIHGIVGENGAGKSTLMNILFGMSVIHSTGGYDGKIHISGEEAHIGSPIQAMELGIGMVHQEFMLIPGYSITENILFWADSGSMPMYTMSSPYPGELGDWKNRQTLQQNPNHKAFMNEILKLDPIQREKAYKNAAIENIKTHPKKYFSNWMANVGRLLFSYPYSNAPQTIKTYFTILPNMFVIVFIVVFSAVGLVYNKRLPDSLILLICFFVAYLFGSTLVSAYRRMFFVTMPFWTVFVSYIYCNVLSVKIQKI